MPSQIGASLHALVPNWRQPRCGRLGILCATPAHPSAPPPRCRRVHCMLATIGLERRGGEGSEITTGGSSAALHQPVKTGARAQTRRAIAAMPQPPRRRPGKLAGKRAHESSPTYPSVVEVSGHGEVVRHERDARSEGGAPARCRQCPGRQESSNQLSSSIDAPTC